MRRRTAPIYGRDENNNYLLVASNGDAPHHPLWYLNLVAHPEVATQVGAEIVSAFTRIATTEDARRLMPPLGNMNNHSEMVKILFRVPEEDGSAIVETLWATPLGGDHYQLDNSPFYAYSGSWKDVVYASFSPEEQRPTFRHVLEKSGHKTIRVIFEQSSVESGDTTVVLKQLLEVGCSYEGANPNYVCIDIPPELDLQAIRDLMIKHSLQFEHADLSYAELYTDEAQ